MVSNGMSNEKYAFLLLLSIYTCTSFGLICVNWDLPLSIYMCACITFGMIYVKYTHKPGYDKKYLMVRFLKI